MADKKFRVFKLRSQDQAALGEQVNKLKEELQQLKVSKVAGGTASKLGRIKVVRKQIAKYLTVINEKNRSKVREDSKKRLPKELRLKKTRAIRRRLSRSQSRQKTVKQWKKVTNFPLREFAIKN